MSVLTGSASPGSHAEDFHIKLQPDPLAGNARNEFGTWCLQSKCFTTKPLLSYNAHYNWWIRSRIFHLISSNSHPSPSHMWCVYVGPMILKPLIPLSSALSKAGWIQSNIYKSHHFNRMSCAKKQNPIKYQYIYIRLIVCTSNKSLYLPSPHVLFLPINHLILIQL